LILFRGDDRPGLDPYFLGTAGPNLYLQISDVIDSYDGLYIGMPTNRWLHVAATLDDGTGLMRLYIDGAVVAEKTTAVRPLVDLDPLSNPGWALATIPATRAPLAIPVSRQD